MSAIAYMAYLNTWSLKNYSYSKTFCWVIHFSSCWMFFSQRINTCSSRSCMKRRCVVPVCYYHETRNSYKTPFSAIRLGRDKVKEKTSWINNAIFNLEVVTCYYVIWFLDFIHRGICRHRLSFVKPQVRLRTRQINRNVYLSTMAITD